MGDWGERRVKRGIHRGPCRIDLRRRWIPTVVAVVGEKEFEVEGVVEWE